MEKEQYRRRSEVMGKYESAKSRPEIPFLRHPDRAGFGLLLSTCATSSTSPRSFANQPDDVLSLICLRLEFLISDWKTQIEEDSDLRDEFHKFIDEFSSIPSHRTLRPDIRAGYTITTHDGVYMISGLRSESVRKEVIGCFSQYIDYLEKGDYSNDPHFQGFLRLVAYLVCFEDELQEFIRCVWQDLLLVMYPRR
ncbi:hypothetical protein BS47DRAFT_773894 [Hydnum rufescens UP504]|uniref:Uncharacterized protein n=1 Tax=Hydnum rufescens UP504 TaxID=1448309 RepID=A0A9P6B0W2_9AGAM|nr:hypothetical protein BS47DRAFT_773894 [Hydnum rufescens UP504]